MSRSNEHPFLVLSLGVLAASSAATLVKLTAAPALTVAAYRMIFASITLAPIALIGFRREILDLKPRAAIFSVFAGILLAIHFGTWIKSLDYISIPASVLLVNSSPAFVVILSSFFLGERARRKEVLGIIIAMMGMVLLVYPNLAHFDSLLGSTLAVIGAVAFASYLVVGRGLRRGLSLIPYIFLVYSVATVTLLASCLCSGAPLMGYTANTYLLMLAVGLIPTVLGHSAFNWSVRYLKVAMVSIATLAVPVFASLIAWLVLNEIPTPWAFGGGALILTGIYFANKK